MNKLLVAKIKESLQSVLPLTIVVSIVLLALKVPAEQILMFLFGALLLIIGLVVFSIGASQSMMYLSKEIGSYITKKRNLPFFILIAFLIGFLITISEPSVWVLGEQFESTVPLMTMVIAISLGSALFIIIALLRIVFRVPLNIVIIIIYGVLFLLAFFIPKEFVPVAFDAGGFSTGPMAVPFLISLGFGVVSTSSNANIEQDNFGTLGITSIGPIFAVLILGLFFKPKYQETAAESLNFFGYLLEYISKVGIAIVPFVLFFIIFQIFAFKYPKKRVIRIFIGFALTYLGLVLFLTGAAMGFMNIGGFLGKTIAEFGKTWLIPFGLLFGLVIVLAEPSVVVLVNQVQEATDGMVSKKVMLPTLSIGVSGAIGLSMIRIAFDLSIWWFLIPGYLIVIILSFFVPKMFTAIAVDSGGAVSGALASTFLVPFALGAGQYLYSDGPEILKNAFGLMAFVVMAPLITIQVLGLIYKYKSKEKKPIETEDKIIEFKEENYGNDNGHL